MFTGIVVVAIVVGLAVGAGLAIAVIVLGSRSSQRLSQELDFSPEEEETLNEWVNSLLKDSENR